MTTPSSSIQTLLERFFEADCAAIQAEFRPGIEAQHAAVERLDALVGDSCRCHGFVGAVLDDNEALRTPFQQKLQTAQSPAYYEMMKNAVTSPRQCFRIDTFQDDVGTTRYRCIVSYVNAGRQSYHEALIVEPVDDQLKITAVASFAQPRYPDDPIDETNSPSWRYSAGDPERYRTAKSEFDFDALGKLISTERFATPEDEISLLYHDGDIERF